MKTKLAAISLALILAGCGDGRSATFQPAPIADCDQRGVLATVWSLKQLSDHWSSDGYRLEKDDMSIWIANGADGLSIATSGLFVGNGGFESFTGACRALLYGATQDWHARMAEREALK